MSSEDLCCNVLYLTVSPTCAVILSRAGFALGSQLDDEGTQQWQEALGRPHCRARVRNHPPLDRPEPHPGRYMLENSERELSLTER